MSSGSCEVLLNKHQESQEHTAQGGGDPPLGCARGDSGSGSSLTLTKGSREVGDERSGQAGGSSQEALFSRPPPPQHNLLCPGREEGRLKELVREGVWDCVPPWLALQVTGVITSRTQI